MGAVGDQPEQPGVILLDDDDLGQAHRLDDLAQVLAVLGQPPQQQKDVQGALDAARVGLQPHGKDGLAAVVGQALSSHLFHIVGHGLWSDGRQGEGDLDDLFQVLGAVQLGLVISVAHADAFFDHLAGDAQDKDAAGHVKEKLDRLQYLDRLVRQAAVQVVHKDGQPAVVHDALSADGLELAAKVIQGRDLVAAGEGLALLHVSDEGFQAGGDLFLASALGLAAEQFQPHEGRQGSGFQPSQRAIGQRQVASGGCRRPVEPCLKLTQFGLGRVAQGVKAAHAVQHARDEGAPQRWLVAVEPGIEPDRPHGKSGADGFLQPPLDHAHQAGLALSPAAKDADGQRRVGAWVGHDVGQRFGVGAKVQLILVGRLVGEDGQKRRFRWCHRGLLFKHTVLQIHDSIKRVELGIAQV